MYFVHNVENVVYFVHNVRNISKPIYDVTIISCIVEMGVTMLRNGCSSSINVCHNMLGMWF